MAYIISTKRIFLYLNRWNCSSIRLKICREQRICSCFSSFSFNRLSSLSTNAWNFQFKIFKMFCLGLNRGSSALAYFCCHILLTNVEFLTWKWLFHQIFDHKLWHTHDKTGNSGTFSVIISDLLHLPLD